MCSVPNILKSRENKRRETIKKKDREMGAVVIPTGVATGSSFEDAPVASLW